VPCRSNLGLLLLRCDRLQQALDVLRVARDRPEIEIVIRRIERLLRLEKWLPEVLRGGPLPGEASDLVGFADLCYLGGHHAAAVRLYRRAFEAELPPDDVSTTRLNAAHAATMAGEHALALECLRQVHFSEATLESPTAVWLLRQVKVHPHLAGVRGEALAKLPEEERREWAAFWMEVNWRIWRLREGR
jgi:hypothetical protein